MKISLEFGVCLGSSSVEADDEINLIGVVDLPAVAIRTVVTSVTHRVTTVMTTVNIVAVSDVTHVVARLIVMIILLRM